MVVSHPYTADGDQASAWELLTLDGEGLTSTGHTFELGRGQGGPVRWAPDGSIGVAVHDDGTLGLFTREGEVLAAAWTDGFYASHAVFDALGERLYVVDGNWVENGGGVIEVAVDCLSGAPTRVGKLTDSKLGSWLLGDVLIADAAAVPITLPGGALGTAVPLFDYADAIVGGADRHGDTLYVGDNSFFSGVDNRVAVAQIHADGITRTAEVRVEDPYAIVAVAAGAVVSSGYADTIVGLTAAGVQDTLPSELPGAAALGPGGLVLVAEVSGVRLVRFDGQQLEDVGFYPTPGLEGMVGSIGVAP